MIRVRTCLVDLAIALMCVSCTSTPPVVAPAIQSFDAYVETSDLTDHLVITAVLAYIIVDANVYRYSTLKQYSAFFSLQYALIRQSGRVHHNYPLKATEEELRVAEAVTDEWLRRSNSDRGADYLVSSLTAYIHQFIASVHTREYDDATGLDNL